MVFSCCWRGMVPIFKNDTKLETTSCFIAEKMASQWAIILYRKSMGSVLVVWILHDVRVQSKLQNCDTIEWWWANIRHVTTSGSHHRVCLQGLAYKVNVHLCSNTSWYDLPQCPWLLLRLMPYVKCLLTFRITVLLSGVLVCVCGKWNLNWLIVTAKLTLPK